MWKCARKQFQGVQINIMPTLPNYRRDLISCSPVQVTKIISWINFMCLSLKFSPFFFSKFEFFLFFVQFQIFAHIWSLTKIISSLRWWKQILTVCTSCKTSYIDWSQFPCHNLPVVVVVVVHWHSWKGVGGGGGGSAKESLQILDLQRLASLGV